jgi:hypothetical protein
VQYSLLPYFGMFEHSVAKWLLTPEESRNFFLRFNFEGLLRADSSARATFYNSALQNGWMNRNEVRAKENLNRVEGLDEYTVQSNMTVFEQLAALNAARSAPAPAPVQEAESPQGQEAEEEVAIAKAHARTLELLAMQKPPEVHVTMPELKMPAVTVNNPPVHVVIEKSGALRTVIEKRDDDGLILSARQEEIH